MTTCLPLPAPAAYVLQESMRESPVSASIFRALPDEGTREEVLLKKLGATGWGRMHHFRHFYQEGWGETGNRELSPKALDAFRRFLAAVEFPSHAKPPSVFLTDQGGLELCWEDANGKGIQVEFNQGGIEYYRAASDVEAIADFGYIGHLAHELSSH